MGYMVDLTKVEDARIAQNSHITLLSTFVSGTTPVSVTSPAFKLTNSMNAEVTSLCLLRDIEKVSEYDEDVGKYVVTFLTNGLTAGVYKAKFEGSYGTATLRDEIELTLREKPVLQVLLEMLRTALRDKYNCDVPNRFWLRDATKQEWSDEELVDHLTQALWDINEIDPISTEFTFANVPCRNMLLLGAQLYALAAKEVIEAVNFFQLQLPVGASFYKGDKFASAKNWILQVYVARLEKWKRAYNWRQLTPRLYIMPNMPVRMARAMSMDPSGGWGSLLYT